MKPTIEEVLELVEFKRDIFGILYVNNVRCSVQGSVAGSVGGNVGGSVGGSVWGNVYGDVKCNVSGTINGREWEFVETPKEKAIRLIREGKGEEAIQVLEESE
jgi:hypothetical protein